MAYLFILAGFMLLNFTDYSEAITSRKITAQNDINQQLENLRLEMTLLNEIKKQRISFFECTIMIRFEYWIWYVTYGSLRRK